MPGLPGGIMLPNHASRVIAEEFGTPDRSSQAGLISTGIGRPTPDLRLSCFSESLPAIMAMGHAGDALTYNKTQSNLAIEHGTERESLPAHPDLRRLLEYWRSSCGERPFPRRADIDPLDFHFMLDRVALTEVHGDQLRRYRMRLVGTFWRDLSGVEMSGTWVDDLPTANLRDLTIGFYEAMIAARKPRFTVRDAIIDDKLLRYEIMLLPLSEDGDRISMILTGIGRGKGQA